MSNTFWRSNQFDYEFSTIGPLLKQLLLPSYFSKYLFDTKLCALCIPYDSIPYYWWPVNMFYWQSSFDCTVSPRIFWLSFLFVNSVCFSFYLQLSSNIPPSAYLSPNFIPLPTFGDTKTLYYLCGFAGEWILTLALVIQRSSTCVYLIRTTSENHVSNRLTGGSENWKSYRL